MIPFMLFSLVLPTYNEAENVGEILARLEALSSKLPYVLMIVVVDDNSVDGTANIVKGFMR